MNGRKTGFGASFEYVKGEGNLRRLGYSDMGKEIEINDDYIYQIEISIEI